MEIKYTVYKTTEVHKIADISDTNIVCIQHYNSCGNSELTAFINNKYGDFEKEKHKITIASGNYIQVAVWHGSIELEVKILLSKNSRNKIVDKLVFDRLWERNKYLIDLLNMANGQDKGTREN